MSTKIEFSIDVNAFKTDLHLLRNDFNIQRLLSSGFRLETLPESLAWAEQQVASKGLKIILADQEFAGFIKLYEADRKSYPGVYSIGLVIVPAFQRMGLGKHCISMRSSALEEGSEIVTEILKENLPSRKLFESLGFVELDKTNYKNVVVTSNEWLIVRKSL